MKIINTTNIQKAINEIKKSEKPIIVKAQDDAFNRKILEYGKFDILLSPEAGKKRVSLRQENSGLNHVLAKIAAKNQVAIGIDLEDISKLDKKEKASHLAKIMQNIKVCRKTGTKIILISKKNKREVLSLFMSLGASTKQAKEA